MYKLHYSTISPFSRCIKMLFDELNIKYEIIAYNSLLLDDYLMMPPLNIIDKNYITDINSFIDYLNKKHRSFLTITNDYDLYYKNGIFSWCAYDIYNKVTNIIIFEKIVKFFMKSDPPSSIIIRNTKQLLAEIINLLNERLNQHKFIAGEQISYSDFMLVSHITILDYLGDINWQENNFKNWYMVMKSRLSVRKILAEEISGFSPSVNYRLLDF